jgi:hypothetical protein
MKILSGGTGTQFLPDEEGAMRFDATHPAPKLQASGTDAAYARPRLTRGAGSRISDMQHGAHAHADRLGECMRSRR